MIISASLVAVYIYTLTILTEFGFLSYFGVPSDFVEASLVTNTIYLRQIGEGVLFAIKTNPLSSLGLLILVIGVYKVFLYLVGSERVKYVQVTSVVVLALCTLHGANSFGLKLAANGTGFPVLSNCTEISSSTTEYVVPAMRGNSAIAVPIGEGNKLLGGFYLKDMSSVDCKLEWKEIGLIAK